MYLQVLNHILHFFTFLNKNADFFIDDVQFKAFQLKIVEFKEIEKLSYISVLFFF